MLYAVLEKPLDVNAIIDNVVMSDRYTHVRNRSALYFFDNLRKRFAFHYIACTGRAWRHSQRMCYMLSTYFGSYKCLFKTNSSFVC